MALLFKKAAFLYLEVAAEFYSTTSEHEHVKMSAARGFESAPVDADKTRQRVREVIVTAGSAAK